MFYGSIGLSKIIQQKTPWVPGTFCTFKNYECTHYYPIFGDMILNNNYIMIPFGDISRQEKFLFDKEDSIFIRPNRSDKIFTGKITSKKSFKKDIEIFSFSNINSYDLCVIAPYQKIVSEWRFIISNNEIITGSEYLPKQTTYIPSDIFDFCKKAIYKNYQPDPIWVMDICRTETGELYILEIGAFSVSGLYKCDIKKVVEVASKLTIKEWREVYEI